MQPYRLVQFPPDSAEPPRHVMRVADQAVIPFHLGNRDYQEYVQWLAEGNEPDPASEAS